MRLLLQVLSSAFVPSTLLGSQSCLLHGHQSTTLAMTATATVMVPLGNAGDASQPWIASDSPFKKHGVEGPAADLTFKYNLIQSAKNMEHILCVPHHDILHQLWATEDDEMAHTLTSWLSVRSASDVFMEPMGKFDITKAYNVLLHSNIMERCRKLLERFLVHELEQIYLIQYPKQEIRHQTSYVRMNMMVDRLASDYPDFDVDQGIIKYWEWLGFIWDVRRTETAMKRNFSWYVTVKDLQFEGYFGELIRQNPDELPEKTLEHLETIFKCHDAMCPTRQHLILHYRAWCKPENLVSIDELADVIQKRRDGEEYEYKWPADWTALNPRQLLVKMQLMDAKHSGMPLANRQYNHLDSLQDAGRIRVVRCDWDLYMANKSLNGYVMEQQELDDAFEDRIVAVTLLNEHDRHKAISMRHAYFPAGKAGFLYLPNSCATQQPFFDNFLPSIQAWKDKVTASSVGGGSDAT